MEDLAPITSRPSTIMNREEALEWKARFGTAAHELRRLIWEGHERLAYRALGYQTWTDCVDAIADEYGLSKRHLWRLNSANFTESLLTPGSVGRIPEKHLRPLTRVKPEQRPEAWQKAVETAPEGRLTAAHVQAAVDIYYPRQPTPEIVIPPRTDRETARGELFRCLDLLQGPLEWTLLLQLWRWLRDAQRDNLRLQQVLERIRDWHMPDVEPPDADIPEAMSEPLRR
jgi:hypothetical protein